VVEVIWVDDASRDDGAAWLVEQMQPGWRLVAHQRPRGAYAARNTGLKVVTADSVAFTDVDCRPSADWIDRGIQALTETPRVAGRIDLQLSGRPSTAELVDAGRFFRQRRYVEEGFGATANLFVRRSVFATVGAFDEALRSGGDYEFGQRCSRAGFPIRYDQNLVVSHSARASVRELLVKAERVGFGTGQLVRRGGIPIRALAARAFDRLALARGAGSQERAVPLDSHGRGLLVRGVHVLVLLATVGGALRGFVFPGRRRDRRGAAVEVRTT
jgi:glycosyltransferase involved in cell wall biosynthesis